MVKRSNSIMKRILQIMMILKGLKVGLLCYMWVNLMWKSPIIKKETCSDGLTSKVNLNCYKHGKAKLFHNEANITNHNDA